MFQLPALPQPLAALLGRGRAAAPSRAQPQAPPVGDAALVAQLQARYEYARRAKEAHLRTWATCLAFYVGDHYRRWDRRAKRLVEPTRLPSWRVQIADNQIPGAVEQGAAKLARSRQLPRAMANTSDPDDEAAAEAGTRALEHWWHVDGMELKELEANIHRILFGCCFFHDYWDPSRTAKVPVPTGQFDLDPETGQIVPRTQAQRAVVGDVCVEVLSVFDVFPEPAERWEDVRWCIVARRRSLEWIRETFPERGGQVQAEKGDAESAFDALLPSSFANSEGAAPPEGDAQAVLKVYYEAPSKTYPQGRHVIYAGETLLFRADELPLPHGEIPVSLFGYRPVPKRLWPMGNVEAALDQQRELNRSQNYLLENLRLHGRPQRMVPKAAKVDHTAWTTSPDEILEYDDSTARTPPGYLQPPGLPGWVSEFPERLTARIQNLFGQHEVSNAKVPTGVTAASAIRLLQEQDDTRLAVAAIMGKRGLEKAAGHILSTIVERYREPRLMETVGKSRKQQVVALMGADIGDRDVLVQITEGAANSEAVKTERFFAWQQAGVFQAVFTGQMPGYEVFVEKMLHELGETAIAEALQAGLERQAQAQQEMQAQQAEMLAAQQEEANAAAENAQAAQAEEARLAADQGAAQQAQQLQAQALEAQAGRDHELQMAALQADQAQVEGAAGREHQAQLAAAQQQAEMERARMAAAAQAARQRATNGGKKR